METSSVLFLCLLASCSVCAVTGGSLRISIDDEEQFDMAVSEEVEGLPGKCWACKWILDKMKKFAGPNATAESLKGKLLSICNEIGLLKSLCSKFVKSHLSQLIEELTTSDDVRTICVNAGACKPKEFLDLHFYPREEDSHIEIKKFK